MSDKDKVVEEKEVKEAPIKKVRKPIETPMAPYKSAGKGGVK